MGENESFTPPYQVTKRSRVRIATTTAKDARECIEWKVLY